MARPQRSITELYGAAQTGERRALGKLLTFVERGGVSADEISELAHPDSGRAHIVGITGAPGAGKSTLVGELVTDLVEAGKQPAVLAVDPSSPLTGGAILGDRIRMETDISAISGSLRSAASADTGTESAEAGNPRVPRAAKSRLRKRNRSSGQWRLVAIPVV